jgi:hypothetical protein
MESVGWACYGTCVETFPHNATWVPPYRGTRGSEGLATYGTLWANSFFNVPYSVTIIRTQRPGYNTGGTDFASATVLPSLATTILASISDAEPGQLFKFSLAAGTTLVAAGMVEGSTGYGTNFYADLYDSSQSYLDRLTSQAPMGRLGFQTVGITNSGSTAADYYLKLWAYNWPTVDLQMTLGIQPPVSCDNATINKKPWRPSTIVTYQFTGTNWGSELGCVEAALSEWQNANAAGGLNVTFQSTTVSPNITFVKTPLAVGIGGATTITSVDSDGCAIGALIKLTSDTTTAQSCTGFQKIALHELGHTMGLADIIPNVQPLGSVMNQGVGRPDDYATALPVVVTSCDANQAYAARNYHP